MSEYGSWEKKEKPLPWTALDDKWGEFWDKEMVPAARNAEVCVILAPVEASSVPETKDVADDVAATTMTRTDAASIVSAGVSSMISAVTNALTGAGKGAVPFKDDDKNKSKDTACPFLLKTMDGYLLIPFDAWETICDKRKKDVLLRSIDVASLV